MVRILITDDEIFTVKSIKLMLIQQFPEAEIETCNNGMQAISRCKEKQFDVALMDINMPGIEGLSAIKEMKRIYPNLKIIIVSAHGEFEYAQRAISLGVDTYLLKPIVQEKLIRTISEIIEEINFANLKQEEESEIKRENIQLKKYARKELMEKIILGEKYSKDLGKIKSILGIEADAAYMMAVFWNPCGKEEEVKNEICILVERVFEAITLPFMENSIVSLISNGIVVKEEEEYQIMKERVEYLVHTIKINTGIHVAIGIGSRCIDFENLHNSFLESRKAVRTDSKKQQIYFYSKNHTQNAEIILPSIENEVKKIIIAKPCEVEEEIEFFIKKVFHSTTQIKKGKVYLVEFINQLKAEVKMLYRIFFDSHEEMDTCYQNILFAQSELELEKWIVDYVKMISMYLEQLSSDTAGSIIQAATQYMDQHYKSDLTLEMVAEHIHISYYYLSRIFKEKTGYSFTVYLINKRMQIAMELLQNSEISIKDVALSTGYGNQAYFGKLFKEKTKMTPSEYREGFIKNH